MASREYWQKRFIELEKAQQNKGVRYYHDLEKQYSKAARAVDKELTVWYSRLAVNNEVSMTEARKMLTGSELEEFRWSVEEYIEKGRTLNISKEWSKQLENASARWHISRLEAMKLQMQQQVEALYGNELDSFDRFMREIYTDSYYGTAFEIQKGVGIGHNLAQLDTRKIDKVMSRPWAPDGSNFSSRIWKQKTQLVNELNNVITQSFIRGQSPDAAIKHIADRFLVSKGKAANLVMTETAFFHSAGQRDMFKELGVQEYEIVATLDSKTSTICQELDGTHRPMTEFEPGVTAPPFHCRCRSTTVPYFDDEFTEDEQRAARGKDEKTYYVPSDMTYPEWKEKYVDNTRENVIIKSAKDNGINGVVNINPKPLNLKNYSFDNTHINAQRQHNVTREEAEKFMNEAAVSLTRWNGQFVNYYGENGAVYIDTKNKVIKTAFKKEEFDEKINNFMKVVLNDGK